MAGRGWDIEPDLSGAAPFFAAALVTGGEVTCRAGRADDPAGRPAARPAERDGRRGDPGTERAHRARHRRVHGLDADLSDVSELTPVLAALAALADSPSRLRGVGHIRGHETDRLAALARELPARAPRSPSRRTAWRSAPAAARRRLRDLRRPPDGARRRGNRAAVPGVELSDVACTSKTMPEFPALWAGMAAAMTRGGRVTANGGSTTRTTSGSDPAGRPAPYPDPAPPLGRVDGLRDGRRPWALHRRGRRPRGHRDAGPGARPARRGGRRPGRPGRRLRAPRALARIVRIDERTSVCGVRPTTTTRRGPARTGARGERGPARDRQLAGRPAAPDRVHRPVPGRGVRRRHRAAALPHQGRPGRPSRCWTTTPSCCCHTCCAGPTGH